MMWAVFGVGCFAAGLFVGLFVWLVYHVRSLGPAPMLPSDRWRMEEKMWAERNRR